MLSAIFGVKRKKRNKGNKGKADKRYNERFFYGGHLKAESANMAFKPKYVIKNIEPWRQVRRYWYQYIGTGTVYGTYIDKNKSNAESNWNP